MKALIKISILSLFIAALAFAAWYFFFKPQNLENNIFIYEIVQEEALFTSVSATGSLEPVDRVEIGTQVSGDIAKINVDFNQPVKKGQVLAELDKSKWITNLQQAKLSYEAAQNDFEYKKRILERAQKLSENKSISTSELETIEYNYQVSKIALARSKSEVEQASLNLSNCIIKSPIDGVVLERAVDVGQTVAASMSAPILFVLAKDLSQMKVMASIDEADIGVIQTGQSVHFTVDAYPLDSFSGTVQEIRLNPTVSSNVVTYLVVISASNPKQQLLPGMTATCTIITQKVDSALTIPIKATQFRPQNTPKTEPSKAYSSPSKKGKSARVWIDSSGVAIPKRIQTGINDGVKIQVLQGLQKGDSFIIGEQNLSTIKKASKESSPFMPQRRRR